MKKKSLTTSYYPLMRAYNSCAAPVTNFNKKKKINRAHNSIYTYQKERKSDYCGRRTRTGELRRTLAVEFLVCGSSKCEQIDRVAKTNILVKFFHFYYNEAWTYFKIFEIS